MQYGTAGTTAYALGAVTRIDTQGYKVGTSGSDDAAAPDPRTVNTYDWYDGAVLSTQAYTTNINDSSPTTYLSTFTNSPSGTLTQVIITDGRPRKVTYTTDMNGEVLIRDEDKKVLSSYTADGPKEIWYRFNGREMNYTTNNGKVGVSQTQIDYATSIQRRTELPPKTATNMFAGGASTTATYWGDVDSSYEAVTSFKQGTAGGRHIVRAGETLQSIAQATWGDSSYWYKIAEANGLNADSFLAEGQSLAIPAGAVRTKNNASTFKPYDASEAIGDTAPTRVKPPKPKKSGLLGKLLIAAIAIAVVAIVAPWAAGFVAHAATGLGIAAGASATAIGAVVGGAIAGAAGSIVSQGVGVATGLQDKFSWKGVAMAALSGAVGGGLGPGGVFGKAGAFSGIGSKVATDVLRGATANAITQGVGVATGLQSRFDWAGVAVAGVVTGAVGVANRTLAANGVGSIFGSSASAKLTVPNVVNQVTSGMAGAIAGAATKSIADGSDFGDNIVAALPDVIGSTVANAVAGLLVGSGRKDASVRYAESNIEKVWNNITHGLTRGLEVMTDYVVEPVEEAVTVTGTRLWNATTDLIAGRYNIQANIDGRIAAAINSIRADLPRYDLTYRALNAAGFQRAAAAELGWSRAGFDALVGLPVQIKQGVAGLTNGAVAFHNDPIGTSRAAFDGAVRAAHDAPSVLRKVASSIGADVSNITSGNSTQMYAGSYSLGSKLAPVALALTPAGEMSIARAPVAVKGFGVVEDVAVWDRLSTVGRTPGKSSATGRAVIERMASEGRIVDDPLTGRMFQASDRVWYPLELGDMSHTVDVVTWWNSAGRGFGAKAPEVRQWMLDPTNYTIDYYSINRGAGARLGNSGVRYLAPINRGER